MDFKTIPSSYQTVSPRLCKAMFLSTQILPKKKKRKQAQLKPAPPPVLCDSGCVLLSPLHLSPNVCERFRESVPAPCNYCSFYLQCLIHSILSWLPQPSADARLALILHEHLAKEEIANNNGINTTGRKSDN